MLSRSLLLSMTAVSLALAGCGSDDKAGSKARPPALVGATNAATADYAPQLVALGTVTPLQSVAVRPRIDGQITRILFQEGDFVGSGQPLFQLDDRVARADLAQSRAALASARASAAQARGDFKRAEALVGKGFISAAVLDQRRALADSADAAIAGAQAQVQNAEAVLSYLTIRAPVSGRTGEIGFRLGANVRAGDAVPLVTVNQMSPTTVRFLVPPGDVQNVRSVMTGPGVLVAAHPQNAPLGSSAPLATGRLTFLDNNVGAGTGAVAAKAEFANPDDSLWPGAIVNVVLPLGKAEPRIALPEAAVQTGRDAPFVWAIGPDNKVVMRDVTVAGRADGRVYLASGVQPGEKIVVDALSKLKPGDKVRTRDGGPGKPPKTAAKATAPAVAAAGSTPVGG
jgi:multidrug efflux system membrane fusion protein